MLWLGIDGGGTKTQFELFDGTMQSLATLRLGTCHPAQVGFEGMAQVLAQGLDKVLAGISEPVGIGLGLAGYGQDPSVRARMRDAVEAAVAGRSFELVNDVQAAWAASLGAQDGVALICGTGSIAYAVCGGHDRRAGGWGFEVGDEGSGWWMGREVLRLFSRQADGRDARGALYDMVMERLGFCAPYDVISYAHNELSGDRTRTAALSRILCDAATAGDPCAQGAIARAAEELADIARAASAVFDEVSYEGKIPVSYVGGVFEGAGALLLDPLADALSARFELRPPLYQATVGPCLLLQRRLGKEPPQC